VLSFFALPLEVVLLHRAIDDLPVHATPICSAALDVVVLIVMSIADATASVLDVGDGRLDVAVADAGSNDFRVVWLCQVWLDLERLEADAVFNVQSADTMIGIFLLFIVVIVIAVFVVIVIVIVVIVVVVVVVVIAGLGLTQTSGSFLKLLLGRRRG
jgi:hypothetical protein